MMDNISCRGFWGASAKPFWLDEQTPTSNVLSQELIVDVAIIGGGFAGLSTAYSLIERDPNLIIAILDAGLIGSCASGANSGQCSPRIGGNILGLLKKYGPEKAAAIYQYSLDLVQYVQHLINKENIQCDLECTGQLNVATTELQAVRLQNQAQTYQNLGFNVPYLDKKKTNDAIFSPLYKGAIKYVSAFNLNPAKLCTGLKTSVQNKGVWIYENTPVQHIRPGDVTEVVANNHTIRANTVVLTTNAFINQFNLFARQIVPMKTNIMVSDPLTGNELSSLKWKNREGIYDAGQLFSYYRLTKDNRILFGGGYEVFDRKRRDQNNLTPDSKIKTSLLSEFRRIFPSLKELGFPYSWGGKVGMTLDSFPIITKIKDTNIFYAGGWNGHGVAQATAIGPVLSDLIEQKNSIHTIGWPWIRSNAPKIPPSLIAVPFLKSYMQIMRSLDTIGRAVDKIQKKEISAK